ncbi:NAD(P)-dependent dehydrogenase, short-chain alcohol dehydrogenase family [Nonomuraea solani]|uniref:NAD(P)-dependent dehydrogenase, short-chain alcohol dehydrogenase family n=1 Tax=Nonomuraea solani TaxID=1144553 RepID=A0A1H6EZB4_9ACTN|nr:SDR family oxidoreductase [Nonomuraea solani]SEH03238.1 NAD(P)-dependent dehydrogenase, short-chain alcohol dehydrogenase family [Nonomuraea solani]
MTNRYRALFDLTGKSALVMGAASGIGQATAQMLAGLGAQVVCADLDGPGAVETAKTIVSEGGTAQGLAADLGSHEQIARAVRTTVDAYGRLDIGVTTPGINIRKRLAAYTEEEFDRIVNLNLKGTFFFLKEASTVMAEQGGGSLIACSSMRALMVEPGLGVYASTKAAILQMARGLATEVGPQGVRVNTIAPGVIDTPLTRPLWDDVKAREAYSAHTVFGRWGSADEVASAVAFLASDAASYVTGENLVVDAGWTVIDGRFDPGR